MILKGSSRLGWKLGDFYSSYVLGKIWVKEQNSFAQLGRHNNGGGYFQPLYKGLCVLDGYTYEFTHSDTSCGDFGSRHSISILNSGHFICSGERPEKVSMCFGSMLEADGYEDELTKAEWDLCQQILNCEILKKEHLEKFMSFLPAA